MELEKKIESVLFFKGEPMSINKLAEILKVGKRDIEDSLETLKDNLSNRGVSIIQTDNEVMLGTSSENAEIIERIKKEELTKNLGKAGIETLTIVMYLSPISKPKIDFIRGVNSVTIIRNLLVRGLVKKISSSNDNRTFSYKPTVEALSYIGVNSVEDLPEYANIKKMLLEFDSNETDDNI